MTNLYAGACSVHTHCHTVYAHTSWPCPSTSNAMYVTKFDEDAILISWVRKAIRRLGKISIQSHRRLVSTCSLSICLASTCAHFTDVVKFSIVQIFTVFIFAFRVCIQNIQKLVPFENFPLYGNGLSEKKTTSVQWTILIHMPPIDLAIELIHLVPPRSRHLSTQNNRQ